MSCCAPNIANTIANDVCDSDRAALLHDLRSHARPLADGNVNYQIAAPSMHCGHCIATLEGEISKMPGVEKVRANLSLRQVSITLHAPELSLARVLETMDSLGFKPQSPGDVARQVEDPALKSLIRALAVAGFASANIMLLSLPVWSGAAGATESLFHFISALIAVPTVAYSGQPFFRSAWSALKHRNMNMDVPISLGVLLATVMSLYESFLGGGSAYFDAAVSLLFFLLIGRTLDYMMRNRARQAASRLALLAAKGGMVVGANGALTYLPLEGIKPGMILRVAAGERFPVDGTVVDGSSDVDRALVTGESAPIAVQLDSSVEAGTLNLTGSVDLRATRPADQSFLAEITQMMAAAENGRSTYMQLSDRMARAYAPVVHILALTTFVGWMIYSHGSIHASLTAAVSVLIITCPCALGLAVPVAHVVSAGRLFAAGILMKDGSALERLAAIDEAAFDKTGTLTTGEPTVRKLGIPAGEAAGLAKALALRSAHPGAKAIATAIAGAATNSVFDLREVPGHGVQGVFGGRILRLGRATWVAEIALPVAQMPVDTGVAFAIEGGPFYYSTLSERLRKGAAATIENFAAKGIKSCILSGDAALQVQMVAKACSITAFHSGLKPGDKLAFLKNRADAGKHVLMVGDGLNDAPALAAAHVSIAPANASDVGRTAADFVLTTDDLTMVNFAHMTALKTARIVKENFALAIIYNVFAVPLAMAGQLNPLIAAIAMSSSSIIVVGNSLRLQLLSPKREPDLSQPQSQTNSKVAHA